MGAVMGSKKLKALAVRGTKPVPLADKETFLDLKKKHADQSWAGAGKLMYDSGEDGFLDDLNASGRLPTKAFQQGTFEHAEALTGETMSKTMLIGRQTCYACRNSCYRVVKGEQPYPIDSKWGGPEYESVAALGSLCLIGDLNAVCKANELCNKYTLDTISTGVVVAFAMECYEKGLLTKKDTGSLELTWGNHAAELQLIEKIARREGIGDLLAEGVARAAKKIGRGAEKFALAVKGQELPMHEPRGKKGLGLSYAVSNRGACHLQMIEHDDAWEVPENMVPEVGLIKPVDRLDTSIDKVRLVKATEDWKGMVDSLTLCMVDSFPSGPTPDVIFAIVNSVTGWNMKPAELVRIGERAFNLCRAFNVREGFSRKDDALPERLSDPLPDGPYRGQRITGEELQSMLDNYYEVRGWDKKTGIPTAAKLKELGLDFVAEQLRALGKLP
jgi:aldehyde:ferredoxin oxidoreductase